MAGLYAKELMLRGDLQRMLIIAPGGLVEQWQDELYTKFGLDTELLTRDLAASAKDGYPFTDRRPMLIARMDQLSRSLVLLPGTLRMGPGRSRRGAPDVGELVGRRAA